MKKFTMRVRESSMVKWMICNIAASLMICNIAIFLGTCRMNDLKVWAEKVKNSDRVKEIKAFIKDTVSRVKKILRNSSKVQMAAATAKKAKATVQNFTKNFIDKVHDHAMKKEYLTDEECAVLITPTLILSIGMIIAFIAIAPVMLSQHSLISIAVNLAVFGFTVPACVAMILCTIFGAIPIPKEFFKIYNSLPFIGLEKNSYTIYLLQCKFFSVFKTLAILTMLGYIVTKTTMEKFYEAFLLVTVTVWRIGAWTMCVNGLIIFFYCLALILAPTLKRKLAKGKRVKPGLEIFTFKKPYVPKRLAQGNTSIKRKKLFLEKLFVRGYSG